MFRPLPVLSLHCDILDPEANVKLVDRDASYQASSDEMLEGLKLEPTVEKR